MISGSPVEQGTVTLSPAGWEIEAHAGLNDLGTGIKEAQWLYSSSEAWGTPRARRKRKLHVVYSGLCSCHVWAFSPCTAVCAGAQDSPSASAFIPLQEGKGLNSRAALQEKQGGVFKARGIPVHCAHLQDCGFTLFLLIPRGHTPGEPNPSHQGVCAHCWKPLLVKAQLQAEASRREQLQGAGDSTVL